MCGVCCMRRRRRRRHHRRWQRMHQRGEGGHEGPGTQHSDRSECVDSARTQSDGGTGSVPRRNSGTASMHTTQRCTHSSSDDAHTLNTIAVRSSCSAAAQHTRPVRSQSACGDGLHFRQTRGIEFKAINVTRNDSTRGATSRAEQGVTIRGWARECVWERERDEGGLKSRNKRKHRREEAGASAPRVEWLRAGCEGGGDGVGDDDESLSVSARMRRGVASERGMRGGRLSRNEERSCQAESRSVLEARTEDGIRMRTMERGRWKEGKRGVCIGSLRETAAAASCSLLRTSAVQWAPGGVLECRFPAHTATTTKRQTRSVAELTAWAAADWAVRAGADRAVGKRQKNKETRRRVVCVRVV